MKNKKYIYPLYLPWGGCPGKCIFCHQPLVTGTDHTTNTLVEFIKKDLKGIDPKREWEFAFYGGNFPGLPLSDQEILIRTIKETVDAPFTIRISTRPDVINHKKAELLWNWGVSTVELGVQSSDDKVLEKCSRGHKFQDVLNSTEILKSKGFSVGWQIMLGLPDDSLESVLKTLDAAHEYKVNFVRLSPTLVIKDTLLAEMYLKGEYRPLSLDEAVEQSAAAYQKCMELGIKVIRLGLALSDDSGDGHEKVLAGPYHQCFKLLVESYIAREWWKTKLNIDLKDLKILCNPADESSLRGWKNGNLSWWKEINPDISVVIRSVNTIPDGWVQVGDEAKPELWRHSQMNMIIN